MATYADKARKADKVEAITQRLKDMGDGTATLLSMLDETRLDLLILALGIGTVDINRV